MPLPHLHGIASKECNLFHVGDTWASGHWHYERTLYSSRPLQREWSFYLGDTFAWWHPHMPNTSNRDRDVSCRQGKPTRMLEAYSNYSNAWGTYYDYSTPKLNKLKVLGVRLVICTWCDEVFHVRVFGAGALLYKEEKLKMVNDHYWYTRLGIEWFLCGPVMANCKSGGPKRMQW